MSDEHTLKSFEIRHLDCCFIRTEGVKWKFRWKKMSCFVMHRLVCTPDHWLPIYIKYTYKHTSPAVPLIKLCTPTNRARIHPRGAFFLNLSIILVQFNNMQGPLTVPYQGHSNDETLRKSKPTKKKKPFDDANVITKKGYTSKKETVGSCFQHYWNLARLRQAKVYNNQGSAWADIQATIETALRPFHQDKMCALKAKDGNRE